MTSRPSIKNRWERKHLKTIRLGRGGGGQKGGKEGRGPIRKKKFRKRQAWGGESPPTGQTVWKNERVGEAVWNAGGKYRKTSSNYQKRKILRVPEKPISLGRIKAIVGALHPTKIEGRWGLKSSSFQMEHWETRGETVTKRSTMGPTNATNLKQT